MIPRLLLASLMMSGIAFAEPAARPPGPQPLSTIFEHTADVKVADMARPVREIKDAKTIKEIGAAIGGAQVANLHEQRKCPDSLRLTFLDAKGQVLATAGFCSTSGLADKKPFDGPEISFGANPNVGRGQFTVADPTALAHLLAPAKAK